MLSHLAFYQGFGASTDLPAGMNYSSLEERIARMSEASTYAGEYEIDATARSLFSTIVIQAPRYRRVYGSGSRKLGVRFTEGDNDNGHYDCLIEQWFISN